MSGLRAARAMAPGALILFLSACGGGDTVDLAKYCDAVVAIETVAQPNINAESQEEFREAVSRFTTTTLRPLTDQLLAVAPPELAQAYAAQDEALAEVERTGDFATAFQTPEVQAAVDQAHAFDVANCAWDRADVTAADYVFEGVPATLDAGPVTFDFANASEDGTTHQMTILRKSEGATEPFAELLALPPEELGQQLAYVAGTFADPGNEDYVILNMEPGEYAMVCLLPLDDADGDPQPTDPTHATEGMIAEFTVL